MTGMALVIMFPDVKGEEWRPKREGPVGCQRGLCGQLGPRTRDGDIDELANTLEVTGIEGNDRGADVTGRGGNQDILKKGPPIQLTVVTGPSTHSAID